MVAGRDLHDVRVVKDMAISHADFFRIVPAVLDSERYVITGNVIYIDRNTEQIAIHLSPESFQQIASLRLPRTEVEILFSNCSKHTVDSFMANFELRFRRGGG